MSDPQDAPQPTPDGGKFDQYAADYETLHAKNIAATGEAPEYFSRYKLNCLTRIFGDNYALPVLDYGCGVGSLTELLVGSFQDVHGYDPSGASLARAKERAPQATFHAIVESVPDGHFGLVVLAGVLHHVPPGERSAVMQLVKRKLHPRQGKVVVFEHNPLNPLTRRAVAMCPYDDDAVLLTPWQASGLLKQSGFSKVRRDYIVFFPKPLAKLRFLEPYLSFLPAGAQMLLIGDV